MTTWPLSGSVRTILNVRNEARGRQGLSPALARFRLHLGCSRSHAASLKPAIRSLGAAPKMYDEVWDEVAIPNDRDDRPVSSESAVSAD